MDTEAGIPVASAASTWAAWGLCVAACLGQTAIAAEPGNPPTGSYGELTVTDGRHQREAPEMPAELEAPSRAQLESFSKASRAERPELSVSVELPTLTPDLDTAPPVVMAPPPPPTEPALVRHENPDYPREALLDGTEGWVRVAFEVEPDGKVRNVTVLEAEPARLFNRSAIRAVKRWRFEPTSGAAPGARRLERLIEFRLDAP